MSVWRDPSRLAGQLAATSQVAAARLGLGWLSWAKLVRSGALLIGLAAVGFAWARLSSDFSLAAFEALIVGHGPWGAWLLLALGTAVVAVGAPRQAVAFAGGYFFGFWPGLALGLGCSILSAGIDFGWARGIGRATVKRRLAGRLARIDHFLTENPFNTILMLRLLPIGGDVLISLISGISGMSAIRFLLGSAVGYVPQAVVFALLGAGTRLGRGTELAVAIGLFVISAALGVVLFRRQAGRLGPFSFAKGFFSGAKSDGPGDGDGPPR